VIQPFAELLDLGPEIFGLLLVDHTDLLHEPRREGCSHDAKQSDPAER
jgi:hypothetical protein